MKKINQQAAKIFCKLLDKMGTQTYFKFTSEGFMPLVMEQVGELHSTPYGTAQLYSLAHYYEQNGDLMRDPEMVFIVVDNRKDERDYDLIGIYPQLFQQDSLDIYEESVNIVNNKVTTYKPVWQAAHVNFANQWLRNMQHQRFLNR
jgi:hypothetical protein